MNEVINEKISVITLHDCFKGSIMPLKIKWRGREYNIKKLGYHHKVRVGRTLIHIFSVTSETTAFKLQFDTDSLGWTVEEVCDQEEASINL